MAKRKFVHHGSRRKETKTKVYVAADAGAQALDISDADLIKIVTVASAGGVQITLNLADIYEGQVVYIDFDSNDASDTLTVELNGTSSSIDVGYTPAYNVRQLTRVVILDVDGGSEKGSIQEENAAIT